MANSAPMIAMKPIITKGTKGAHRQGNYERERDTQGRCATIIALRENRLSLVDFVAALVILC